MTPIFPRLPDCLIGFTIMLSSVSVLASPTHDQAPLQSTEPGSAATTAATTAVTATVTAAQSSTAPSAPALSNEVVSGPMSNANEVDPFLGADFGGNVFVGATVPFGMVKLGPDVVDFDGRPSGFGYASVGRVVGFSHTHLSGASGKYGNILVDATTGPLDPSDPGSVRAGEKAEVAYYRTRLLRYNTQVELTASRRVGMHRDTFPQSDDAHITVGLDHILNKGTGSESQKFLGGSVKVVSNHEVEGMGRYTGGWNGGGEYRVYFYLLTDTPARGARTWVGRAVGNVAQAQAGANQALGASLDYATAAGQVIQAKVGISFISIEQARRNVESETPDWNFDAVRATSVAMWDRALSAITLNGANASERHQIYTALYHTMMMPVDRSGENPDWHSSEPYYDDYYTVWDTFRTVGPLLTLIAPDRQRDIVRSMIDIYRHEGYMPDGRSGNANGRTQGGSNADVVLADAFVKGLSGIDYGTALKAMEKDADVPPPDAAKEGRGGLLDYISKGYVTTADQRSGSRTVEYSYDDFAISELACGLGHPAIAKRYLERASNWKNLWDSHLASDGVQGFLRPRSPDGSWAAPNLLKRGTWPDFLYEGDIWTYSSYVPQDVRGLITQSGGDKAFIRRLDTLFYKGHFDMSNEPGFLIPMLYLWAGRPDKTADLITLGFERSFLDSRSGLPGNDDSGAMSAWLIFESLGIYPNAGQDVYLISTPRFPEAELKLANGKVLRIVAHHLDAQHANRFIQSAVLNGKPLDQAWFRHSDIANGGDLEFTMGPAPTDWGTHSPPPSMSDSKQTICPEGVH